MRADIIIPTFRREEQLGGAIESVLAEGLSDINIIVVDDSPEGIRSFGHVFVDQDVLEYQTGMPSIIHDLEGDGAPVHASYEIMHGKYRDLHGEVEYRLMQIVGKFIPLPRMT